MPSIIREKQNLLPYRCAKCGNEGEWLSHKLSLQLKHKNGTWNDNRLENLEFLCPNYHSQTEHYAGKNKRIKEVGGSSPPGSANHFSR